MGIIASCSHILCVERTLHLVLSFFFQNAVCSHQLFSTIGHLNLVLLSNLEVIMWLYSRITERHKYPDDPDKTISSVWTRSGLKADKKQTNKPISVLLSWLQSSGSWAVCLREHSYRCPKGNPLRTRAAQLWSCECAKPFLPVYSLRSHHALTTGSSHKIKGLFELTLIQCPPFI